MQRYIYGNIGRAGYQTVSSDPSYFKKNASNMARMMVYDETAAHGALAPGAYRCFLMLTTDLNDSADGDFLFLQESGLDPHRKVTVVQGYRSEPEDGDIYGTRFLKLLDTAFATVQEAGMEAEANETLAPVAVDALPCLPTAAEPAGLERELLENILLTILQGRKRVVLRIRETGAEAMAASRAYLKAIYQRLPYELRRRQGCMTGATVAMMQEIPTIGIILTDGDADLTDAAYDSELKIFDLRAGQKSWAERPWQERARTASVVRLVTFLATEKPDGLDEFFAFCRRNLDADSGITSGALGGYAKKYGDMLEAYLLGRKKLTGSEIRDWAVRLYDVKWAQEQLNSIVVRLSAALTAENLSAYLKEQMPDYENLNTFGVLTEDDRAKKAGAPRDQNAALTMQMVRQLPGFDLTPVWAELETHFTALAKKRISGAEAPTRAVLDQLNALRLPQPGKDADINCLKNAVRENLTQYCSEVVARYQAESMRQDADGRAAISIWHTDPGDFRLEPLYRKLQSFRLYEDLVDGWNTEIAKRIDEVCRSYGQPGTLDGYDAQLAELREFQNSFHSQGGHFTPDQEATLSARQAELERVRELCGQKCETAQQWDSWYARLTSEWMDKELQRKVLQSAAGEFLGVIPDGLSLQETRNRLACCIRCSDLLDRKGVVFAPWNVTEPPAQLLEQIRQLETYRANGSAPELNARLCDWIGENLPQNKDLMILAIQERYDRREALLWRLSRQRGIPFTARDVRLLYLAGCSRKMLRKSAMAGTTPEDRPADSWVTAVNGFVENQEWKSLPDPLRRNPPGYTLQNVLAGVQLGLIALAAAAPAAGLWIGGVHTMAAYGILAGGLAVLAIGSLCAGLFQKRKAARSFLLILAAILLLDALLSVAPLALGLLQIGPLSGL